MCGGLTPSGEEPCKLCTARDRDDSVLCIVEDPSDIATIEKAGCMRGRYHALMGRISPMSGTGPEDLRIRALETRIDDGIVREIILALNTDVESDATAGFIKEMLKDKDVRITRLAFGLPVGSGISYSDPVTLGRAIAGRREA